MLGGKGETGRETDGEKPKGKWTHSSIEVHQADATRLRLLSNVRNCLRLSDPDMYTLTYIDRNIHEILVAEGRRSVSVSDADGSFIPERHLRGHVDTQNHMPECVCVCV